MDVLFNFYSFETARINWCNYIGSQRAVENAVNILLNGSKKYNKRRKIKAKYQTNPPGNYRNQGKKGVEVLLIFMNTSYYCSYRSITFFFRKETQGKI